MNRSGVFIYDVCFFDIIVGVGLFSMVIVVERCYFVIYKNVESVGDVMRVWVFKRCKDVESRCVIVGGCDYNCLFGFWKCVCFWSGK